MQARHMFWLGLLCLIVNGYRAAMGLAAGAIDGGIVAFIHQGRPAAWADEPVAYLCFLAFYLGLAAFGAVLIYRSRSAARAEQTGSAG